jgi:hypothetical protein
MAPIAGASPVQAYQREASRLATATPRVAGKVVTRDAGVTLGPFSIRFTAKDYEFDLSGVGVQASFADALDAAGQARHLGDTADTTTPPNALTRRQALASYRASQDLPLEARPIMFETTA